MFVDKKELRDKTNIFAIMTASNLSIMRKISKTYVDPRNKLPKQDQAGRGRTAE